MNTNHGLPFARVGLSPFAAFKMDIDTLFDDWLPAAPQDEKAADFVPACEVQVSGDHFLVTVEAPGVKKDDIRMEITDNRLIVSGERRETPKKSDGGRLYSERRFGRFQRAFTLPRGIDANGAEADFQDGILRIVLPKAESAKPRQVKITTGGGGSKILEKLFGQAKADAESQMSVRTEKAAS